MVHSRGGYSCLAVAVCPRSLFPPPLDRASVLEWVVDRWSRMLPLVRNGHVSGDTVVCVGRLRASRIELSSRTPLQQSLLAALVPEGCLWDPLLRTQLDGIPDVSSSPVPSGGLVADRWASIVPGVPIVSFFVNRPHRGIGARSCFRMRKIS